MVLQGRTALITGASQGLGRAIAQEYLKAGASVVLVSRGREQLAQTAEELRAGVTSPDQKLITLPGDVGNFDDCDRIVAFAEKELGHLDVLVNNAGVYGPIGRFEELDWDAWVEAFTINFLGLARLCRAAIPIFRRQGSGKIINLSGGGATAPLPRFSSYAGSKSAVVRLTETLAHELQGDGIDINAIAPGALNTRLLDDVLAAGPEKVGREFYEKSLKQRDSGGTAPERGAALAVFLASRASDGITGRLLSAVWDDWANLPNVRDALAATDIFTLRRITPEDRGGLRRCA